MGLTVPIQKEHYTYIHVFECIIWLCQGCCNRKEDDRTDAASEHAALWVDLNV